MHLLISSPLKVISFGGWGLLRTLVQGEHFLNFFGISDLKPRMHQETVPASNILLYVHQLPFGLLHELLLSWCSSSTFS